MSTHAHEEGNNSTSAQDNFNPEIAKLAVTEILEAFRIPEHAQKLDEAKQQAGNNMIELMKIHFPLTAQIEIEVIKKYGFSPDGPGIVRFTQLVRLLEKQDPALAELNAELKEFVMPLMAPHIPESQPVSA